MIIAEPEVKETVVWENGDDIAYKLNDGTGAYKLSSSNGTVYAPAGSTLNSLLRDYEKLKDFANLTKEGMENYIHFGHFEHGKIMEALGELDG